MDRLKRDRDEHGDTQKDRYGAWAHLVSLFRLLFDGVRAATGLTLPARRGDLFDPDRYPFLEGRRGVRLPSEAIEVPRVSDATVLEVLSSLALYKGERLLYGGLDVEHIGGVYEGLMGFDVLVTAGRSACLLPHHGGVELDELATAPGAERLRQLKAEAGIDLKDKAAAGVRGAEVAEGLFASPGRRISPRRPVDGGRATTCGSRISTAMVRSRSVMARGRNRLGRNWALAGSSATRPKNLCCSLNAPGAARASQWIFDRQAPAKCLIPSARSRMPLSLKPRGSSASITARQ